MWYVYIKLVARLNGGKFEMCKISEVPLSSAVSKTPASKMPVLHSKGTQLHMARNIIAVCEEVVKMILSTYL